jgi:hypothetical protein
MIDLLESGVLWSATSTIDQASSVTDQNAFS